MKKLILSFIALGMSSVFATGLVEAVSTMAIQQELQKQSAQNVSGYLKQAQQITEQTEKASQKRQQQLNQLKDDFAE